MFNKCYSYIKMKLKKAPRVYNLEEPRRLPVTPNEPALREKIPTEFQLESIRKAREEWFQNTPQIKRVDIGRIL